MSWTSRLAGPYRAVFDSPKAQDGGELWRAATWKSQVMEVYGAKQEDVSPVLVVRHGGIPLVMDDAFWRRHEIGKKRKINDPMTGKRAEGNPILSYEGRTDIPAEMAGASLVEFLKRGGTVLACNFAFGMMIHYEAEADKDHAKEARERALAWMSAVTTTTTASRSSALISARHSSPETRGIVRSRKVTSGCSSRNRFTATPPSPASVMLYSRSCGRQDRRIFRDTGESSTMRMFSPFMYASHGQPRRPSGSRAVPRCGGCTSRAGPRSASAAETDGRERSCEGVEDRRAGCRAPQGGTIPKMQPTSAGNEKPPAAGRGCRGQGV